MGSNRGYEFVEAVKKLVSYSNIPKDLISTLQSYSLSIYKCDQQNRFSEPMPWIGVYIMLASLICILAMVAGLLYVLRIKNFWFPCKFFTLNSASLTLITATTKLPLDLGSSMPGVVDQTAKLGSMAFMCIMMTNLLPSVAPLDSNQFVANIMALGITVITLVVNVCIQIQTGVIPYSIHEDVFEDYANFYTRTSNSRGLVLAYSSIAKFYVAILLILLVIQTCSALGILSSSHILEMKYQYVHEKVSAIQRDDNIVEDLRRHVTKYWIMAETRDPQFIIACFATTYASGVICSVTTFLHIFVMISAKIYIGDYKSDYKWSMVVILMIQTVGVVMGTITLICRCFAALSYVWSLNLIRKHISVFKVESYWTHKLSKIESIVTSFLLSRHVRLSFFSSSSQRYIKISIWHTQDLIFRFCVICQKTVVVACKTIALIRIFFVICVLYCLRYRKPSKAMFGESSIGEDFDLEQQHEFRRYVLQLEEDTELADRTLKSIIKSG